MNRISETRGLLYIDAFFVSEFSIEKCSFNINLMNLYVISSHNGKNSMDWYKFSNRSKSVKIINTWNLRETLSNQTSLVAYNITYYIFFGLECPLLPNDIDSWW